MITKYRKPLAVAMICMATMAGFQKSATADLRGVMDGMFMNLTTPQSISTPNYNGVTGGNLSLRMPVMGMNIINFSPPSVNMGCSGIDLYMGSFTFINQAQFKALIRAIGNGIIGFAFHMALCGLSESVCNVVTKLEDWIKTLNSLAKNTCNTAKMLTHFDSQLWKQDTDNGNAIFEGTKKYVDDWFAGAQKTSTNGANAGNPATGNLTFKALWQSGAANTFGFTNANMWSSGAGDQNVITLLLNLAGTVIIPTNKADCDTTNNDTCKNTPQIKDKRVTYQILLDGSTDGSEHAWWKCVGQVDDDTGCADMTDEDTAGVSGRFKGTRQYAKEMMFGPDADLYHPPSGDSIYGQVSAGHLSQLTPNQFAFLAQIRSLPVVQAIYRAQDDPAALQIILDQASNVAAENIAYNLESAAYSALASAFGNSTLKDTPKEMKENMNKVHAELLASAKSVKTDIDTLTKFNTLIEMIKRSTPSSYTGSPVSPQ